MFIINDYNGNENAKIDKQKCKKKCHLKWENFLKDKHGPLYIDEDDGESIHIWYMVIYIGEQLMP